MRAMSDPKAPPLALRPTRLRPARTILSLPALAAALSLAALLTAGTRPAAAVGGTPVARGRGVGTSGVGGAGGDAVRPTAAALSLAELVRARSMGIDHAGNLWAWEPVEGSVRFFSPTAERLGTLLVTKGVDAVAGDAEWGAVALADDGERLLWVRPGGGAAGGAAAGAPRSGIPGPSSGGAPATPEAGASASAAGSAPALGAPAPSGGAPAPSGNASSGGGELKLPAAAGWMCWIDADTVAVSPRQADHRVELWDLRQRRLIRGFGKEKPITLHVGANRVREVQLRYDPARRLLYTLESFTGDLEVFTLDGKLTWHATVDNPWRKIELDKLADLDGKAKVHDTAYPQAFSDLWLGEGPDGSAWVRQGVDVVKESVTLIRADARGAAAARVEGVRCPARTFTIWGDHLIFYRDVALPRAVCNSVAPLP